MIHSDSPHETISSNPQIFPSMFIIPIYTPSDYSSVETNRDSVNWGRSTNWSVEVTRPKQFKGM